MSRASVDEIKEVIEILEAEGFDVRTDYSGRCMYGEKCLGVDVDHPGVAFSLGQRLYEFDWMGEPRTDSMGRGIIIYWPEINTAEYNKEVGNEEEEDMEEEGV